MSAKIGTSAKRNSLRAKIMPCTTPDGKPTSTGMATLKSLADGALIPEEVAARTGQPLFKVRSGLRELKNAGLIVEKEEKYQLSKTGEATIK
jgi:hypothetical protein